MNLKKATKKITASILMALSLMSMGSVFTPQPTVAEAAVSQVPTEAVESLINNYIMSKNSSLSYAEANDLAKNIIYYSYQYNVDPLVMTSLFETESTFNQSVVSSAGAIGLGQIMPSTAVALGVNPWDVNENIEGACSYLSTQIKNFSDYQYPVEMALAAYNAGPNAVRKYGGIPPYTETQNYVQRIRTRYFTLYNMLSSNLNSSQYAASNNYNVVKANQSYNVDYVETVNASAQDYSAEIYDMEDDFGY